MATSSGSCPIKIPFAPSALLPVVHVEEVARALLTLGDAPSLGHSIYNAPAQIWEVGRMREELAKGRGVRLELDEPGENPGPLCDSSRFVREFGFEWKGLREHL